MPAECGSGRSALALDLPGRPSGSAIKFRAIVKVLSMKLDQSLVNNACVMMFLSTPVQLVPLSPSYPHLTIQAQGGDLDMDTVDAVLKHTEDVLEKHDMFSTRWDLRSCPLPSFSIVSKCLRWAIRHRSKLNAQNQRLTVLVPPGKLQSVVAFVLKSFGPSCPTWVGDKAEDADTFEGFSHHSRET